MPQKWWLCAVSEASILVIVVRWAGRLADEILKLWRIFFEIEYSGACKRFLVFKAVLDAEWSKPIPRKGDFRHILYFHDDFFRCGSLATCDTLGGTVQLITIIIIIIIHIVVILLCVSSLRLLHT